MSRIQLEGLSRRFGRVAAVDQVNLDIADGDFLVLLGPSGCGKTTLLRMIAGLLPPTDGRILLDGQDVTYVAPKNRNLAMVFQSYALYPHLTVERNIGFPLRARRRPRAEIRRKVAEVADLLELGDLLRRRPKELSGGQRQRVALGRALVRAPGAFLMDEPLSNLDAKLRTATRGEITALHRRLRTTFVYVTHDQVEAMTMATRIALLNDGRVEQVGTPTEVYDEPASVFVAGFLGSPPMNLVPARVESRAGLVHVVAEGIDVPLRPGDAPARDVVLGVRPEHLRPAPAATRDEPGTADPALQTPALQTPALQTPALQTPALQGTVTAVENLGSEEVAQCDIAGARVAVRGPRPLGLSEGDAVRLTATPDRIHLFDRTSGRRLVWQDAGAGAEPTLPSAGHPADDPQSPSGREIPPASTTETAIPAPVAAPH